MRASKTLPFLLFFLLMMKAPTSQGKGYPVQCEDPSQCPDYIAGIAVGVDKGSGKACTGFLISPTLLMTNLHCLPDSMQSPGTSCNDSIRIYFPKTSRYNDEEIECQQVSRVSSASLKIPLVPDYAILVLGKSLSRPPVSLSTEGISDNERITIYKVDPSDKGDRGTLKKIECDAVQRSVYNPLFTEDRHAIVSLIPCAVIPGNSGSPMISRLGKAKGIINSTTLPEEMARFPSQKTPPSVTFGTSFTCVDIPELNMIGKVQSEACKKFFTGMDLSQMGINMITDEITGAKKDYEQSVNLALKKLSTQAKNIFSWKYIESTNSQVEVGTDKPLAEVRYEPQCLSIKRTAFSGRNLKTTSVSLTLEVPIVRLLPEMDSVGRYKVQTKTLSEKVPFKINPQDFKKETVPIRWNTTLLRLPYCE